PYAVFTDPQLGRVGLTEKEARATGRRLKIGKIPMAWVQRAVERAEPAGLMKLVVDAETDRILGAAILSSEGASWCRFSSSSCARARPTRSSRGPCTSTRRSPRASGG